MNPAGLVMAMLLAFASIVPHGAAAAPRPQAVEHHHQPQTPADTDDAACATACIGCSVTNRLPGPIGRIAALRQPAPMSTAPAEFAGVTLGFDPPPPRTHA